MSRVRLSKEFLPAYVDLKPVRRMGKVVSKMAIAKRAADEIALIERSIEADAGSLTNEDLMLAKSEIARFAKIIAKNAKQASKMLKVLKLDIQVYKKELLNAIG